MNKKKIFLGLGAVVLAIGGVFAGRTSAKFGTAPKLYYYVSGVTGCNTLLSSTAPSTFQTGISGTAITFSTSAGGHTVGLYASSGCATPVKFH